MMANGKMVKKMAGGKTKKGYAMGRIKKMSKEGAA